MRSAQDKLCMEMERVTGMTFRQDSWVRDNHGGGITRVMQVRFPRELLTSCGSYRALIE